MSSIRRRICEIRCRWPTGSGGSPGSVTSMRSSASRRCSSAEPSSASARLDQLLERPAHLVRALARPGPRSSGGSSPIERSTWVSGGLAPEVAHAQLLELRRARSAPAIACLRLAAGAARGLGAREAQAWRAILLASSYSATVAAMATLSDSGPSSRSGMRAVCRPRARAARPAAPRARRPGRPRPAALGRRPASASVAPARGSSASSVPGQARPAARGPAAGRTASPCWPARPWASTGPRSPARAAPARRRARGPRAGSCPTLPGSSTACR